MKFELKNAIKFGWNGLKGWAYSSKDEFKNASAAYFEVDGSHGKIRNKLSDRIYYVLEGKGEFIINDKIISVKTSDVIIVPKNTPYDYRGKMKLFLVHTPAFDAEFDEKLE
ncbi:Cupin domain protein [uncultured archaeon]|nr:Cupin domain protein [uncultured archaeon]